MTALSTPKPPTGRRLHSAGSTFFLNQSLAKTVAMVMLLVVPSWALAVGTVGAQLPPPPPIVPLPPTPPVAPPPAPLFFPDPTIQTYGPVRYDNGLTFNFLPDTANPDLARAAAAGTAYANANVRTPVYVQVRDGTPTVTTVVHRTEVPSAPMYSPPTNFDGCTDQIVDPSAPCQGVRIIPNTVIGNIPAHFINIYVSMVSFTSITNLEPADLRVYAPIGLNYGPDFSIMPETHALLFTQRVLVWTGWAGEGTAMVQFDNVPTVTGGDYELLFQNQVIPLNLLVAGYPLQPIPCDTTRILPYDCGPDGGGDPDCDSGSPTVTCCSTPAGAAECASDESNSTFFDDDTCPGDCSPPTSCLLPECWPDCAPTLPPYCANFLPGADTPAPGCVPNPCAHDAPEPGIDYDPCTDPIPCAHPVECTPQCLPSHCVIFNQMCLDPGYSLSHPLECVTVVGTCPPGEDCTSDSPGAPMGPSSGTTCPPPSNGNTIGGRFGATYDGSSRGIFYGNVNGSRSVASRPAHWGQINHSGGHWGYNFTIFDNAYCWAETTELAFGWSILGSDSVVGGGPIVVKEQESYQGFYYDSLPQVDLSAMPWTLYILDDKNSPRIGYDDSSGMGKLTNNNVPDECGEKGVAPGAGKQLDPIVTTGFNILVDASLAYWGASWAWGPAIGIVQDVIWDVMKPGSGSPHNDDWTFLCSQDLTVRYGPHPTSDGYVFIYSEIKRGTQASREDAFGDGYPMSWTNNLLFNVAAVSKTRTETIHACTGSYIQGSWNSQHETAPGTWQTTWYYVDDGRSQCHAIEMRVVPPP